MQGRGQPHCRQKGKGIRGQVCPRPATLCPHFSQAFGSERSCCPAAAFSAPFVLSVPQRVRLRATGTSGRHAALRTVCRRCVGPPVGPRRVHSLHSASAVRSLVRNAGWPGAPCPDSRLPGALRADPATGDYRPRARISLVWASPPLSRYSRGTGLSRTSTHAARRDHGVTDRTLAMSIQYSRRAGLRPQIAWK